MLLFMQQQTSGNNKREAASLKLLGGSWASFAWKFEEERERPKEKQSHTRVQMARKSLLIFISYFPRD